MHVNVGPMRGGKSAQAIAQLIRAELQGLNPVAFKHVRDTRDPGFIRAYTPRGVSEYPCTMFEYPQEIWEKSEGSGVVAVDEMHMTPPSTVDVLIRLEVVRHAKVIVCGLHSTFRGQQWATMRRILGLPVIDRHNHSAVCGTCRGDADWSQRLRDGVPVDILDWSEPTFKVGGGNAYDYRPLCTPCYFGGTPGAQEALERGLIGSVDPETYWGESPK